jgi:hypothetical protein
MSQVRQHVSARIWSEYATYSMALMLTRCGGLSKFARGKTLSAVEYLVTNTRCRANSLVGRHPQP